MKPKVDILYVTFLRDLQWLEFSLMSQKKYAKGFFRTIIAVPTTDVDKFMYLEKKYETPQHPVWIRGFHECPGKGFVHHLAMKCYAEVLDQDADMFLHMDPDCLWTQPVTPDDYIVDGKPVLVIESYEFLKKYFLGRHNWKHGVDLALGIDCKFETMCRHPAIHIRDTYYGMRHAIEQKHLTPFLDYVLKGKNDFPQQFCEFGCLGGYALEYLRNKYLFIDCTPAREARLNELIAKPELKIGHPNEKTIQFWSYRGVNEPDTAAKIAQILL